MLDHVPLVVPEVNPEAIENHRGIIASPNCSTTQMVVAMKPLYEVSRIKRVVVSTYQATSGAGVSGQSDLVEGTKSALNNKQWEYQAFAHPIAFMKLTVELKYSFRSSESVNGSGISGSW